MFLGTSIWRSLVDEDGQPRDGEGPPISEVVARGLANWANPSSHASTPNVVPVYHGSKRPIALKKEGFYPGYYPKDNPAFNKENIFVTDDITTAAFHADIDPVTGKSLRPGLTGDVFKGEVDIGDYNIYSKPHDDAKALAFGAWESEGSLTPQDASRAFKVGPQTGWGYGPIGEVPKVESVPRIGPFVIPGISNVESSWATPAQLAEEYEEIAKKSDPAYWADPPKERTLSDKALTALGATGSKAAQYLSRAAPFANIGLATKAMYDYEKEDSRFKDIKQAAALASMIPGPVGGAGLATEIAAEALENPVFPEDLPLNPQRFGSSEPYAGMGSVGVGTPFSMETGHPGQGVGYGYSGLDKATRNAIDSYMSGVLDDPNAELYAQTGLHFDRYGTATPVERKASDHNIPTGNVGNINLEKVGPYMKDVFSAAVNPVTGVLNTVTGPAVSRVFDYGIDLIDHWSGNLVPEWAKDWSGKNVEVADEKFNRIDDTYTGMGKKESHPSSAGLFTTPELEALHNASMYANTTINPNITVEKTIQEARERERVAEEQRVAEQQAYDAQIAQAAAQAVAEAARVEQAAQRASTPAGAQDIRSQVDTFTSIAPPAPLPVVEKPTRKKAQKKTKRTTKITRPKSSDRPALKPDYVWVGGRHGEYVDRNNPGMGSVAGPDTWGGGPGGGGGRAGGGGGRFI